MAEFKRRYSWSDTGRRVWRRTSTRWPSWRRWLRPERFRSAEPYLRELAEKTGARNYPADSTQNLESAFASIADELRRQYTIGYYPKNTAQAGERRQIRVRVNQPNLAVRTRDSYIFNSAGRPVNDTAAQRSAPVLQRKLVNDSDYRLRVY